MEPFSKIVKSLGGQGIIVPLPRELGLEVATGSKRLACFDHLDEDISHNGSSLYLCFGTIHRGSSCQSHYALVN